MNDGLENLQGHAYAPGFEPTAIAEIVGHLSQIEMLPFLLMTASASAIAGVYASRMRAWRLKRRKAIADAINDVRTTDLTQEFRALRQTRQKPTA